MTGALDIKDYTEAEIVIHAMTVNGSAYGRVQTNNEHVYVSPGIARRFNMRPGDSFEVRVVKNHTDRQDTVPWRVIYVYEEDDPNAQGAGPVAPAPRKLTDEEVKSRAADFVQDGRAWSTRDVFLAIFKRAPDYGNTEDCRLFSLIGGKLRSMCRDGLVFRSELYTHAAQAHVLYFCTSIKGLVPTAHVGDNHG